MADEATIEALAKDIAGIESGGRYDALGPQLKTGDRAHGKYQIMGNNIPAWSEEAGLGKVDPQAFLKNPDLQEKVARFKLNQYYDKFGNAGDVASMWHSGVPLEQAKREGRKDVLGTTTESYAARVGGEPSEPAAPDVKVKLPDGSVVNLGPNPTPELREQVKAKILTKWPELASKTTAPEAPTAPPAPADFRDTSVEEAGRQANRALGADEASSVGKYAAGALKPAYDAVVDFSRGLMKVPETIANFTRPSKIQETAETVMNLLHPLAVPAEAAGNVAFQGLTDAGASPEIAAGIATAVNLIAGAKTPLPGAKAALARGAGTAERAAAASGAAMAKAGPSEAAALRATETLTPAGVAPRQGAQALEEGLGQKLAEIKEPTQGIYEAHVAAHGADALDPAKYKGLSEQIGDLRDAGRLRGEAARPIEALATKIDNGEKVLVSDLNDYKRALDEVLPGGPTGALSLKERELYNLKFKIRDLIRENATGDEKEWLNAADTIWRDVIIGKGKPRALGNLVKLVKKDPDTALARLFGTGASEKQGETATAVMKALEGHAGGADEALRQAMSNRMIKSASDAEGALDPTTLLKQYNNLNENARNAFFTPGTKAFFKAANDAQKGIDKGPGKLAKITAEGLHFTLIGVPLEMLGRSFGVPGVGLAAGVLGRKLVIPPHDIAKFLANVKTSNLMARALKTPANSAVVPAILRQLRDSDLGKQLLKSPEGQQKQEEAKQMLAGEKGVGYPSPAFDDQQGKDIEDARAALAPSRRRAFSDEMEGLATRSVNAALNVIGGPEGKAAGKVTSITKAAEHAAEGMIANAPKVAGIDSGKVLSAAAQLMEERGMKALPKADNEFADFVLDVVNRAGIKSKPVQFKGVEISGELYGAVLSPEAIAKNPEIKRIVTMLSPEQKRLLNYAHTHKTAPSPYHLEELNLTEFKNWVKEEAKLNKAHRAEY